MADAESVRYAVERWLRQRFGDVHTLESFDFVVPRVGTTAIFLDVVEILAGRTIVVRVMAPLLLGVRATDDLLRYIGHRSGDFVLGHLALIGAGRDRTLVFSDALLAESLTEEELMATIDAVAATAEELDLDLAGAVSGDDAGELAAD
jgi:hypothetical protein